MTTTETTYDGPEIEVAWNAHTRRWERVYPETELGGQSTITMFWCRFAERYITIPAD